MQEKLLKVMEVLEKINKIARYKTWTVKRKVDALLEIDAINYTELGLDSSDKEKQEVKSISRKIYKLIAQVSPIDGYILEAHMNEKDMTNG